MKTFIVPNKEEVSENNKVIFENMEKAFGRVPNLYATFAYNETALGDYLSLQNRKASISTKEREVINLVVSQINLCEYCIPAHTVIAKMQGFTDEQIIEIRKVEISFNIKLASLAVFVKEVTLNRGKPSFDSIQNFFEAGYDNAALIDICMIIGDKIISNYLHGITQIPIDWPQAPSI